MPFTCTHHGGMLCSSRSVSMDVSVAGASGVRPSICGLANSRRIAKSEALNPPLYLAKKVGECLYPRFLVQSCQLSKKLLYLLPITATDQPAFSPSGFGAPNFLSRAHIIMQSGGMISERFTRGGSADLTNFSLKSTMWKIRSGREQTTAGRSDDIIDDGPRRTIAVLDMDSYFSEDLAERASFVQQLREQCNKVGLFYVENHGVPAHLCDSMLAMARQVFDLPADVKAGIDYRNSAQFRGYMKLGVENTAGIPDYREQMEFGPEDEEDFDISDGCQNHHVYPVYRRLRGPNQWPSATCLPDFQPTAIKFMDQLGIVSMHLMQALALSLGLEREYFDSTFTCSPHFQMKISRYPPNLTKGGEYGVGMFGVGPHSDTGFLSLLLQDNVGGLQAQLMDGDWIDVPPIEGTLVVNLGEMLQLATHGFYLATVHRVVSLPGTATRYSVPFFFNPRLDSDVRPMDLTNFLAKHESKELLNNTQSQSQYRSRGGESTHGGKNILHSIFGLNTFKSFARSHPEVVRRHHQDLLDRHGILALREL